MSMSLIYAHLDTQDRKFSPSLIGNVSCHYLLQMNRGFSLNYPSISVIFKRRTTGKKIKRRLTNVGSPNSIYSMEVRAPEGVKVKVKPKKLIFKHKSKFKL
ncbi:hypothetical protein F2P56_003060 [Juglans regia]|uniref:Subtilisin-like protease fibronectin type-III domain-containing protein n=1 Tax=Juglans regia TaxID=51240 RepID=A0A834D9R1_JUGRE|nr:hypothetical protein F2P56_003060 [Juglans regia]